MRNFNKREQKIIKHLAQIKITSVPTLKQFLSFSFFTEKAQKALLFHHTVERIYFYHAPELKEHPLNAQLFELFELVLLLEYLHANRLLSFSFDQHARTADFLFGDNHHIGIENNKLFSKNGRCKILLNSAPEKILNQNDEIILKGYRLTSLPMHFVSENLDSFVFPSAELVDLANHRFKSKEDRRHRRGLFVAWAGIILALLIGLAGIYIQLYCR